jgi:hypothetical protein
VHGTLFSADAMHTLITSHPVPTATERAAVTTTAFACCQGLYAEPCAAAEVVDNHCFGAAGGSSGVLFKRAGTCSYAAWIS